MKYLPRILVILMVIFVALLIFWIFTSGHLQAITETPTFTTFEVYQIKYCKNGTLDITPQPNQQIWGWKKYRASHIGFNYLTTFGMTATPIETISFSSTKDRQPLFADLNNVVMVSIDVHDSYTGIILWDNEGYGDTYTLSPNECVTLTSNVTSP